jgi:hypothetical protein
MNNETISVTKDNPNMNFDLPFGFNIAFGFNCYNLIFGVITSEDFQMISALVGLAMNLIYFIVKMYWMIKNNKNPDNETQAAQVRASLVDLESSPIERKCLGCGKMFDAEHFDQIFHDVNCKDAYLANLKERTPFNNLKADPSV